jgi:hypothetical protein
LYKPAVQYGWGQPVRLYLKECPWKWYEIIATMDFGFAIANNIAGLGKTVGLWVNVTL